MSLLSSPKSAVGRFVQRAARGLRPAVFVAGAVAVLGLLFVPAMFRDVPAGETAVSIGLAAVGYGGAVLLLYGSGAVKPNESGRSPSALLLVVLAVLLAVMLVMEFGG